MGEIDLSLNEKLSVLQILQKNSNKYITANEIANLLGISERTVYRYIKVVNQDLKAQEVEIVSTPGLGYQLVGNSFHLTENVSPLNIKSTFSNNVIHYLLEKLLFNERVSIQEVLSKFYISESVLHRVLQSINSLEQNSGARIGIDSANIVLKGNLLERTIFFVGQLLSMKLNHEEGLKDIFQSKKKFIKNNETSLNNEKILEESYTVFDRKIIEWSAFIIVCQQYGRQVENIQLHLENFEDIAEVVRILNILNSKQTKNVLAQVVETSLTYLLFSNVNEKKEEAYFQRLNKHLISLVKQKQFSINIKNNLLDTIKKDYALEYQVSGLLAYQMELAFDIQLNKNDVGFIALYLATLSKKKDLNGESIKGVIISNSLSTGFLFRERVRTIEADIEIVEVLTEWEMEERELDEYEVVINLTQNEILKNKECIRILDPLSENALDIIAEKLRNVRQSSIEGVRLLPKAIHPLASVSREDVLAELLGQLSVPKEEQGRILQQILEREKITSTAIGNAVAIPHTILDLLEETKIIVGIKEDGILWEGDIVRLVFLIVFAKNEPSQNILFRKIYIFTRDKERVNKLIKEQKIEVLTEYLEGESHGTH